MGNADGNVDINTRRTVQMNERIVVTDAVMEAVCAAARESDYDFDGMCDVLKEVWDRTEPPPASDDDEEDQES